MSEEPRWANWLGSPGLYSARLVSSGTARSPEGESLDLDLPCHPEMAVTPQFAEPPMTTDGGDEATRSLNSRRSQSQSPKARHSEATPGPADLGSDQSPFAQRIAGVFATRIGQFLLSLAAALLLARLLEPAGRGQYAVVMLLPLTLYAMATFGLPSSTTFYSGRGRSLRSLRRVVLTMSLLASAWLIGLALLILPFLERHVMRTAPDDLLRLILVAIPFQFSLGLIGSILYGRQIIRNYNVIIVAQAVALLVGTFVSVAVLQLGVRGAVLSYILVTAATSGVAFLELNRAVSIDEPGRPAVSYRELLTYGLKLYPSVVTSFFGSRVDIYLLSWLLGSDALVGLYAVAVSLAEVTYYVPDSVSSIFFPRVASATRVQADSAVAEVSRVTGAVSAGVAVALVPASFVILSVVLPHSPARGRLSKCLEGPHWLSDRPRSGSAGQHGRHDRGRRKRRFQLRRDSHVGHRWCRLFFAGLILPVSCDHSPLGQPYQRDTRPRISSAASGGRATIGRSQRLHRSRSHRSFARKSLTRFLVTG